MNFTFSLNSVVFVKVEGMEVGVTAALKNQEGNLKLSVLECECHVKYISIKLDGGASWLYQGYAILLYNQVLQINSQFPLCSNLEGFVFLCGGASTEIKIQISSLLWSTLFLKFFQLLLMIAIR